MTNDIASKHNSTKQKESSSSFIMTQEGKIISDWREVGNIVHEVSAYGQTLGTYGLGVNCTRVVRHRVTVVTETFSVLES